MSLSAVSDGNMVGRSWESMVAIISNAYTSLASKIQDLDYGSRSWDKLADDLHEFLSKQSWLLRSHIDRPSRPLA